MIIYTNNFVNNIKDLKEDVIQLVINSKNGDNLKKFKEKIEQIDDLSITNTNINLTLDNGSYFCDINLKGTSKGIAVKKLMDILNLNIEEVICFGDSMNDYEMFQACNYTVAMKNATKDLKDKAYFITEFDNNENGVAKFIEKYIL